MTPSGLHAEFLAALSDLVVGHSDLGVKPLELEMQGSLPLRVRVYMYNATRPPGGRPAGEYKIQPIVPNQERGQRGNFDLSDGRTVLLVGYAAEDAVFVLWDAGAYRDFSYSRNVQVKSETILAAFAPRDRTARAKAATGGRDDGARDGRSSDRGPSRRSDRHASRSFPQASPGRTELR